MAAEIYPDASDSADRVSYAYNRQRQIKQRTDQNGTVHQISFDPLGRTTLDAVPTLGPNIDNGVLSIGTGYEVRGMPNLITSYSDSGGTTVVNQIELTYNNFQQLFDDFQAHSSTVGGGTPKVEYDYEDGSANTIRRTSLIPTAGSGVAVNYTYGSGDDSALSRASSLAQASSYPVQYTYLGLGSVVQTTYALGSGSITNSLATGSGKANRYAGLDLFGRVIDMPWTKTTLGDLAEIKHGYDQASNRTFRQDVKAAAAFDELYAYDRMQRLKKSHRGTLLASGNTRITTPTLQQGWRLDATGNWTNFTNVDQGTAANTLDQQRTSNLANEITAIGATVGGVWQTPAYDRAGNMTTVPKPSSMTSGYTAKWDAWNRLVLLSSGATAVQANVFDGLGRRIIRKLYTSGTLTETRDFYYSGRWQAVEEYVGGAQTLNVWGLRYVDDLYSRTTSGGTYYALQDANWNVIALCDGTRAVVERYAYTAYGVPLFLNSSFVPLGGNISAYAWETLYCGYRYDTAVGLYFVRHRELHPTLGCWLSRDKSEIRGGRSRYVYGRTSPLRALDPLGLYVLINARDSTEYYVTEAGEIALEAAPEAAEYGGWIGAGAAAAAIGYYLLYGKDSRKLNDNYVGKIGDCPCCAFIWIHGYQNSLAEAQTNFTNVEQFYKAAGGNCDVYGFAWNSDPGPSFFWGAKHAADQVSTGAFAKFMLDFVSKCPATKFFVGAHSLGARVALGAFQNATLFPNIAGTLLVEAAVDRNSLEPKQEFSFGSGAARHQSTLLTIRRIPRYCLLIALVSSPSLSAKVD